MDLNAKKIEKVEKEAKKYFDYIKLDEDSYLIKANMGYTEDIDLSFKSNELFTDELKVKIQNMTVRNGDGITVTVKKIIGATKILEIINLNTLETITVELESDLNAETREELVNFIAYTIKEKGVSETIISFHLHYNFNILEKMVKNFK